MIIMPICIMILSTVMTNQKCYHAILNFSLTKNKVVGLGLVPGGCAACFADGSVEALVEDAVRFERADGFGVDPAKTPVSGSSPAVFRRVVLRASLALFGGGVSAVSAAEGTADGARLRPERSLPAAR